MPYIRFGTKPGCGRVDSPRNPLKRARCFQDFLDSGRADSQQELARLCGISRSTVAAYLRLLKLDAEVQASIVELDDADQRLQWVTERRLRGLHCQSAGLQRERLQDLLGTP